MKIATSQFSSHANSKLRRHERAMLLIDCVMYVGLFFLITGIAFCVFYNCWDSSKHFRRNTDEISGTLKAGERWRADVRSAAAPLSAENTSDGPMLHILQKSSEIDYRFSGNALWRRAGAKAEWVEVLPKVKSSRMEADARKQITGWRWEVELQSQRKNARIVPLFTFEAVPQIASKP